MNKIDHRCWQDRSREFITLLARVSALGKTIPLTLLYKAQSVDLQSTWVEDLGAEDDLFFGVAENGSRVDERQIRHDVVFEPRTRPTRITTMTLLIGDGHSSHSRDCLHMQHIDCNHSTSIAFSPPIVLCAIALPPDAQDNPTKPPPTPKTSKSIHRAQKTYTV
jgi:hypothetical protein